MKIDHAGNHVAGIGKKVTAALRHVGAQVQHEVSSVASHAASSPAPVRTVVTKAIERVVGKPAASPAPASPAKVAPRVALRSAAQKVLGNSSTRFLRGFAHASQAVAASARRALDSKAVASLGTAADKFGKPLEFIGAVTDVEGALRSSRFASTARGQAWTGLQHLEQRVGGGLHLDKGTLGLIDKGLQGVAGPLSLAAGVAGVRDSRRDLLNARSSGERFDARLKQTGGYADLLAGALDLSAAAVNTAGFLGVAACSTPVAVAAAGVITVAAGVIGAVSLGTEGVRDVHTAIRTHDLHTGAQGALEVAAAVGLGAIAVAL